MAEQLGRCGKCKWWRHYSRDKYESGDCHRLPPVVLRAGLSEASYWPQVRDHDFCGEFSKGDAA